MTHWPGASIWAVWAGMVTPPTKLVLGCLLGAPKETLGKEGVIVWQPWPCWWVQGATLTMTSLFVCPWISSELSTKVPGQQLSEAAVGWKVAGRDWQLLVVVVRCGDAPHLLIERKHSWWPRGPILNRTEEYSWHLFMSGIDILCFSPKLRQVQKPKLWPEAFCPQNPIFVWQ